MSADVGGKRPAAAAKIRQSMEFLDAIGLPPAQRNERSALVLLAFLDLRPEAKWAEAASPLRGITPVIEFINTHYLKGYKPNTRETIRDETVRPFEERCLVMKNPGATLPQNSPKTVYQIEPAALELAKRFGTKGWAAAVEAYRVTAAFLQQKLRERRPNRRLIVETPAGVRLELSRGGQNAIIKLVVEEFCRRYVRHGRLLYVGDAEKKHGHFDADGFRELGIVLDAAGPMPDVVWYCAERKWLLLIEAVSSQGPISEARHRELAARFANPTAGLLFVTAFPSRRVMAKYVADICWQTDVWIADDPDHLIHFDGERFLGPYDCPASQ